MTYSFFLLMFLVVPLAASFPFRGGGFRAGGLAPLGGLMVLVYATTLPWDSAAVAAGLWSFEPTRTWGPRVVGLPLEELLFFGLQALLTGLWVDRRLRRGFAEERVSA